MYQYSTILSNRCLKPSKWSLAFLVLMSLLLAGCDEYGEDSNTDSAEKGNVWSFESEPIDDKAESGTEQSVQADQSRRSVVPASDLAPGDARADVDMGNPFGGIDEAIAAGERHFAAFNCVGCHAPKGGGGMGPPLSDTEWIYGDKPAQIYNSIVEGRPNGMPAFGSMLPEEVVWQLVAYVKTLNEQKKAFVKKQADKEKEDASAKAETGSDQGDNSASENSFFKIDSPDGSGGE